MRVIAGKYGGLEIKSPKKHRTHPMSDKIRGSLFNSLGDIEGLEVLDVFSGSGALSIEAISRGASSSVAIDADSTATFTAKKNAKSLKIDSQIKPIKAYFSSWSSKNQDKLFDVVLADPPYNNLQNNQLDKLPKHIKVGGILVLSLPIKIETIRLETLKEIDEKKYGDAKLVFYRKIS